ncbi:hypothetical protein LH67_17350 [Xenorhabdus nematophila]|nr:hypothetical protein LH67_17350 [Xenorhabdus nematophila]
MQRWKLQKSGIGNLYDRGDIVVTDTSDFTTERSHVVLGIEDLESQPNRCAHRIAAHPLRLVTHTWLVAKKHVLYIVVAVSRFD